MLRACMAGYGSLGHMHADNIAGMKDIVLTAVCDPRPEALQPDPRKKGGFDVSGARTYGCLRDMLAGEEPDLLLVIAPTCVHEELTVMGLEAGVHVFCEKPMSLTSGACKNMIDAARRSGKQLMTGQCIRFWPEYVYLQSLIKDKTYGSLKMLSLERISKYPHWADWFLDSELSGGAATDLHIHDVDWVRWVLGSPERIGAAGAYGKTGGIDAACLTLQYPDTAVFVRGSWVSHAPWKMAWEAYFEDATVIYREGADPSVTVYLPSGETLTPAIPKQNAYVSELEYFASVIRGERANTLCAPESALEGILLLEKELTLIKGSTT